MSSHSSKSHAGSSHQDGLPFSDLRRHWRDSWAALEAMPRWERHLHIFWLLGPFFLLIERTPADIWLTVLSLAFVVRSVVLRQGWWLETFWVRAAFLFWAACLLAAILSPLPVYSLGETLAWFRFPLFAMATTFWLGRNRQLLYLMILSTGIGMVVMCGILTAEILIVGPQGGRLSWPYGDLVPGNYLAKVGLPAFVIAVAVATSYSNRVASIGATIALISIVISVFTGERINFLIRACSGMIAAVAWRPRVWRVLLIVFVELIAVVTVMTTRPDLGNRYVTEFIELMPTHKESRYFRTMLPGVTAFEQEPIFGVGPGNLRHLCAEITAGSTDVDCHPHPHNYYIQMAGEAGVWACDWRAFPWVYPLGMRCSGISQSKQCCCGNDVDRAFWPVLANSIDRRLLWAVEQHIHVECSRPRPRRCSNRPRGHVAKRGVISSRQASASSPGSIPRRASVASAHPSLGQSQRHAASVPPDHRA